MTAYDMNVDFGSIARDVGRRDVGLSPVGGKYCQRLVGQLFCPYQAVCGCGGGLHRADAVVAQKWWRGVGYFHCGFPAESGDAAEAGCLVSGGLRSDGHNDQLWRDLILDGSLNNVVIELITKRTLKCPIRTS